MGDDFSVNRWPYGIDSGAFGAAVELLIVCS